MLYEGAALVSDNSLPFLPTRDSAARHVFRFYADLLKAVMAVDRGARPANRPFTSNSTPATAHFAPGSDTPEAEFFRNSCKDHDTVLSSLQQADDLATKLLISQLLPFAEAVVAYHAAAAALPLPADRKKLIVEKATAGAKVVAMLIVRVALLAGLLPSQHVIDRRIVDMNVADQVEGDTLCSVMQRMASLTEWDGKTNELFALARGVGGVRGP